MEPLSLAVVVPVLIVVALLMVVFQKRITGAIRGRQERRAEAGAATLPATATTAETGTGGTRAGLAPGSPCRRPGMLAAMGAASVYGGYFTAAQASCTWGCWVPSPGGRWGTSTA